MKFTISTGILLLLLGTTASTYARQEKEQEEHKQEAKPAQTQQKPAQQERQEKPAAREQAQGAKPAQPQRTQQVAHTQPQHTKQTVGTQQPPAHAVNHPQQSNAGQNQGRVPQTAGNGVKSEHGRISDVHYASSFGSGHSFRVNRGEYDSRRFAYGGYSFGFVDPWPINWGYSDDVYIIYADGGYYMYDRVHPGVRISVNIF
jgi:hypothetical protein